MKKLHWLIHGGELRNTRDPEKTPSLADCIHRFFPNRTILYLYITAHSITDLEMAGKL